MQRSGATYGPDPLRPLTHVSISSSPSGPLLAHAALSSHNLLPVNFDALRIASTLSPDTYHPAAFTATFLTPHINAEQRSRADAAEDLHIDLCHPSDRSLCANLSTGKLPFSTLTCSDVTLNRQLRGPCPHCAAGKHRNPPHPIPALQPLPLALSLALTPYYFQNLHQASTLTRLSSSTNLLAICPSSEPPPNLLLQSSKRSNTSSPLPTTHTDTEFTHSTEIARRLTLHSLPPLVP